MEADLIYIPKSFLPRYSLIRLRIAKQREWSKSYKWQKIKEKNENTK